jgi:hypothetical protein
MAYKNLTKYKLYRNKLDVLQNMVKALIPKRFFGMGHEDYFASLYFPEKTGTYIDVGAGNPIIFSNTFLFYKRKWKGITVDPLPRNNLLHRLIRPRDKQIKCVVGEGYKSYTLYEFIPSELSTIDQVYSDSVIQSGSGELISVSTLESISLANICFNAGPLDACLLSIDTEGKDFEVLKSNNFSIFNPRVVIIEDFEFNLSRVNSKINELLISENYLLMHWTGMSSIYVSNVYLESKRSNSTLSV